jgi:uncharacterized membrane protein HdeD (DUF308 family)
MQGILKQAWWALLLGGIALVVFGVLAFIYPMATLLVLALFFAASVLVDGVFTVISAMRVRDRADNWWLWLLLGILGVIAGAIGLFAPAAAAAAMVLLLAAYAIATGVLMIWMGVKLRKEITGEWLLILAGALSILFGVFIAWQPVAALLGFVWAIGVWAIAIGALKIVLAFRARRYVREPGGTPAAA